jgi:conjugal transfer pilus assembly protein TraI
MFSWLRKKSADATSSPAKQPIYQWSDDEIPRYPPFMKGLPVVHPDRLLETQGELIERIANTAIATPDVIECYYFPAVSRFASYAHLLPASQSHHHRGAGGMLRHSIEVALWALQSADKVLLEGAKSPSQRREMEPRWQLAVFLAALCHDAGKPVTDLMVTNSDRTAVWKPIKEDLFTWAVKNHVQAYFLDWREGRARQHTALSNLIGDRIIGAETLDWIEEGGTELIVWLMESLTSNPSPTNPLYDLVIKADQTSVERDLKTLGVAMAGYDLGVPVERHLTDIMRRFIKEGLWLVNEPGARVWNIDGNVYLIWPAAGEELAKQVRDDGIPGIPRTPDGILDMLLERQIAFVREDAAPGERLWKIAPAVLVEKIPEIKLPAIRLRDEAMVSTIPIVPVAGRILNEADARRVSEPALAASPIATEKPMYSQKSTLVRELHANGNGFGTEGKAEIPPLSSVNEMEVRSTPAVQSQTDWGTATESMMPVANDSTRQNLKSIALDGAVGEALRALAQDLKSGDKRWGSDVAIDQDQQLLLRWPDSFSGYGLTVKMILDELVAKECLWVDPMTPLKRVMDVELNGQAAKAIRLVPELTPVFVIESGGAPESVGAPTKYAIDSATTSQANAGTESSSTPTTRGVSEAKSDNRGTKTANRESAEQQKKKVHKKSAPLSLPATTATSAPSSPDAPSVKQVIDALVDAADGKVPDLSGWITVAKYVAMSQFKAKKLKVSLSYLNYLSKAHPDQMVVISGKVRFKYHGNT